MPKKIEMDFLVQTFVGELVTITTNIIYSKPFAVQTEEGLRTEFVQDLLCYQGIFVDGDDNYIYLGDDAFNISSCVSRDVVKMIEIQKTTTPEDMILDAMGTPDDKESIN